MKVSTLVLVGLVSSVAARLHPVRRSSLKRRGDVRARRCGSGHHHHHSGGGDDGDDGDDGGDDDDDDGHDGHNGGHDGSGNGGGNGPPSGDGTGPPGQYERPVPFTSIVINGQHAQFTCPAKDLSTPAGKPLTDIAVSPNVVECLYGGATGADCRYDQDSGLLLDATAAPVSCPQKGQVLGKAKYLCYTSCSDTIASPTNAERLTLARTLLTTPIILDTPDFPDSNLGTVCQYTDATDAVDAICRYNPQTGAFIGDNDLNDGYVCPQAIQRGSCVSPVDIPFTVSKAPAPISSTTSSASATSTATKI